MERRHTLVMVSYLNSKPFELGLKKSPLAGTWDILTETPARCAGMFAEGKADVALVPIGALTGMDGYRIITDYCIGCDGEVRTVCIFANSPLQFCKKIWLDMHSRTSVLLSRILMDEYFGLSPEFCNWDGTTLPGENEAVLMIGDKVFLHESSFRYRYDLGEIWKSHTGLPFVFAVWVAHDDAGPDLELLLNQAFGYGVDHLSDIIRQESTENLDLYYYFHHNIRYALDQPKKEAMKLFFSKAALISK